jgi:hypothetical protein
MVVVLCYLLVTSSFENSHVRKKTTGEEKKDKEIRSGPLASFFFSYVCSFFNDTFMLYKSLIVI